jgi:hypothetical protein
MDSSILNCLFLFTSTFLEITQGLSTDNSLLEGVDPPFCFRVAVMAFWTSSNLVSYIECNMLTLVITTLACALSKVFASLVIRSLPGRGFHDYIGSK